MPTPIRLDASPLEIYLICEDPVIHTAVRASCPPPHILSGERVEGIVGASQSLSSHGQRVIRQANQCDVVLMEWRMEFAPIINTLSYHLRQHLKVPAMAVCRGGHDEVVAALAAGADDALTFPVLPSMLQARVISYRRLIDAVIHREQGEGKDVHTQEDRRAAATRFGDLLLDRSSHRFFIREKEVEVTPREFALLDYLIENADTACARDDILDHVWGITFDTGTNMVDVYMYFLRRKLEAYGLKEMIQTVRGYGYRMGLVSGEQASSN